jgi:hypothetical protein
MQILYNDKTDLLYIEGDGIGPDIWRGSQMKKPIGIILFCVCGAALAFAQWPPEVLLHRQGDRPGFNYERIEGLGDWTGDGIDDFAVLSYTTAGDSSVIDIWWGGESLSSDPDTTICPPDSCYRIENAGDLTGDGISELVVSCWDELAVYRGGRGQVEELQVLPVDVTDIAVPGDISGDGIPDLVVGYAFPNGRLAVYLGTPTGFEGPVETLEGVGYHLGGGLVSGADMDGDGWGDFACHYNDTWDTTIALFHPRPGNCFGDYELFYGWSRALIPGAYESGRPALVIYCVSGYCVHLGGAGLDTIADAVLSVPGNFLGSPPSYVGDVNNDGWGDWVAGSDGAFGGLGAFLLFLGGSWISNYSYWMVGAQGQDYWAMGKAMTGVGDVNGDGVDDLAMLCSRDTTGHGGSQLVVFAGDPQWNSAEKERPPLPLKSSVVMEAFPNPAQGDVQLTVKGLQPGQMIMEVWNILGQRVSHKELQVTGDKIALSWDTKDAQGHSVAGGIYFLQVIQHSTSLARHKLLVTR